MRRAGALNIEGRDAFGEEGELCPAVLHYGRTSNCQVTVLARRLARCGSCTNAKNVKWNHEGRLYHVWGLKVLAWRDFLAERNFGAHACISRLAAFWNEPNLLMPRSRAERNL